MFCNYHSINLCLRQLRFTKIRHPLAVKRIVRGVALSRKCVYNIAYIFLTRGRRLGYTAGAAARGGGHHLHADAAAGAQYQSARPGGRLGRGQCIGTRADWVRAAQQRAAARRAQEAEQPDLPPKAEALAHMQALCRAYYPQFAAVCPGGQMPKIAVRDMHTRWGSCSLRTGTLAFAQRLCVMPPAAQEYVVVHEFCHFAHPNHSPAFWAAVEKVLPDYKQREKLLKMR